MKTHKLLLTTTLLIGTTTALLLAQESRPPQGSRPQQGGPGGQSQQGRPQQSGNRPGFGGPGQGGQGGQRPPFPLIDALDGNRDHVIDATEIANATASLKKLDKNGDGKLTGDEFLPQRSGGQGGPGGQPSQGQRERPKSE